MKKLKLYSLMIGVFLVIAISAPFIVCSTDIKTEDQHHLSHLTLKQHYIVLISFHFVQANSEQLPRSIADGLNSGLNPDEIKKVIMDINPYLGLAHSVESLHTLAEVVNIKNGRAENLLNKRKRGSDNLPNSYPVNERLQSWSDEIERSARKSDHYTDVNSTIARIAALGTIEGVDTLLQSHLKRALNAGIDPFAILQIFALIDSYSVEESLAQNKQILSEVINASVS